MSDVKRLYGDKGQYLGSIQEDSVNIRAFDNKGKPVGTYNKSADQTYNANGTRNSFGNTVVGQLVRK
jgi:IMP cyclohydrolase|tara:strand:- start:2542 stop:2742 length:201 start_codon:yes stop_codon:yes gene_type:complete